MIFRKNRRLKQAFQSIVRIAASETRGCEKSLRSQAFAQGLGYDRPVKTSESYIFLAGCHLRKTWRDGNLGVDPGKYRISTTLPI
jgi:hypothetical protein